MVLSRAAWCGTCSVVWVDYGEREQVKKGFVLDIKNEQHNKPIYTLPVKNKWNDYQLYKLQDEVIKYKF